MPELMPLVDCLRELESGVICSVEWVSHDKKRPLRCGRIVAYDVTFVPKRKEDGGEDYYTRLVRIMQGDMPTAVLKELHIPLLIKFNGKQPVP